MYQDQEHRVKRPEHSTQSEVHQSHGRAEREVKLQLLVPKGSCAILCGDWRGRVCERDNFWGFRRVARDIGVVEHTNARSSCYFSRFRAT